MMHQSPAMGRYVDIREADSPEKISLDITRHLQFRASIGRVAIITERPQVLLGVIKKRWSKITLEVKKEYSRTLQADKKAGLKAQLVALPNYTFATGEQDMEASIVFISANQPLPNAAFQTIYVARNLSHIQLMELLKALLPGGLLVSYTSEWDE